MVKESEGFGDSLANFIEFSGIKKVVNKVQKVRGKKEEDCGCNQRQEKLNKIFPYKNKK